MKPFNLSICILEASSSCSIIFLVKEETKAHNAKIAKNWQMHEKQRMKERNQLVKREKKHSITINRLLCFVDGRTNKYFPFS
jgi:hypothetical protein